MQKTLKHFKLVIEEYSSNNQTGTWTYEGKFETFEEFMVACQKRDESGRRIRGLTRKEKFPRDFWGAGGFASEYDAFENGERIPKEKINEWLW